MNHPFLKSIPKQDPLIMETEFDASPERVFKAWTSVEDILQWFGSGDGGPDRASVDLRVDGKWQFVFVDKDGHSDYLSGQYLNIEPNKLLEFSWVHTRVMADGSEQITPKSKVTITFEPRENRCFLRLVHTSISTDSARENIIGGWGASLTKMKGLVE